MQSGVPLPQVVDPMQDLIDYTFEDPEVLVEAFVTFRVKLQNRGWLPEGNKRIAMIGDAVLRLVLVNDFYLGMASRGAADAEKQKRESDANLCRLGWEKGLDKYLQLSDDYQTISERMMATAVEGIFGAVFRDSGEDLEAIKKVAKALGLLDCERHVWLPVVPDASAF